MEKMGVLNLKITINHFLDQMILSEALVQNIPFIYLTDFSPIVDRDFIHQNIQNMFSNLELKF